MSDSKARVKRDEDRHRYVLEINGEKLGSAEYTDQGNRTTFTHTVVDPSLKGQGMGSKLVHDALSEARARGRRIVPVCEFVAAYVRRHPEWESSVDWPDASPR